MSNREAQVADYLEELNGKAWFTTLDPHIQERILDFAVYAHVDGMHKAAMFSANIVQDTLLGICKALQESRDAEKEVVDTTIVTN